jgi:hypothetical protein
VAPPIRTADATIASQMATTSGPNAAWPPAPPVLPGEMTGRMPASSSTRRTALVGLRSMSSPPTALVRARAASKNRTPAEERNATWLKSRTIWLVSALNCSTAQRASFADAASNSPASRTMTLASSPRSITTWRLRGSDQAIGRPSHLCTTCQQMLRSFGAPYHLPSIFATKHPLAPVCPGLPYLTVLKPLDAFRPAGGPVALVAV